MNHSWFCLNRSADDGVDVVDRADAVHRRQPPRSRSSVRLFACSEWFGAGGEERGTEPVAAVLRDQVDLRAAGRVLARNLPSRCR